MKRCFACDCRLGRNPNVAITSDGQIVHVGTKCYKAIVAKQATGYQPPLLGPRLYPVVLVGYKNGEPVFERHTTKKGIETDEGGHRCSST